MIWSKEETYSRQQLEEIQLERLKETVSRVYAKVPAYRKKMDDVGVKPEDIKTLKDLAKLPFVTKQDLRDNYPYGLFAVEKDKLQIWLTIKNSLLSLQMLLISWKIRTYQLR